MANEQNLIRNEDRTPSERRENARKAGIASGKARRERKKLRESLEALLSQTQVGKNGEELTGADAISIKLFEQALKGNVKAYKTIRDTVGEKPIDKVQVNQISQEAKDEVEALINDKRRSHQSAD